MGFIVKHADCVPIFLFDPKHDVVGLVHSGLRGAIQKVGLMAIMKMISEFGSDPKEILVGLGPGIQKCCYKKHIEILSQLPDWSNCIDTENNSIDLPGYIEAMFCEVGILKRHIENSGVCTSCSQNFHSWTRQRDQNEPKGNGVSIIVLKQNMYD